MPSPQPLSGIVVADFSHLLPGPLCGRRLRLMGAEVWKLELPHWPDPARRAPRLFAWLNGGKRLVILDFRRPEGLAALFRLLARADVMIEGFRPGLMDRLGLGYPALSKRFPRLVYASLTGHGRKGSPRAGHDLNYQGLAGSLGDPPSMPSVPVADAAGALEAAARVSAALFARERTGRGARIDVSLTEAAREASALGLMGELRKNAFYGLYPARDGKVLAVAGLERRYSDELLRALGREDLKRLDPLRDAPRLRAALARIFRRKPRAAWLSLLAGREACVGPVLSPRQSMPEPSPRLGDPRRDTAAVLKACGVKPSERIGPRARSVVP